MEKPKIGPLPLRAHDLGGSHTPAPIIEVRWQCGTRHPGATKEEVCRAPNLRIAPKMLSSLRLPWEVRALSDIIPKV